MRPHSQTAVKPNSQTWTNIVRLGLLAAAWLLGSLALLVVLAWLVGRLASDRYWWSQWLLWIPTPAALAAAMVGTIAALRPARRTKARRWRVSRWTALTVAVLVYFIAIEHRFLHRAPSIPDDGTFKLAHWNLTVRIESDQILQQVIDRLVALDSDITVLTGPAYAAWQPAVIEALGHGQQPVSLGSLVVLSRMPIMTVDHIGADGSFVMAVTIDATAKLGRPVVLYAVDLPSNPKLPRMATAKTVRRLIEQATECGAMPAPDIVAGDFNITRDSASISTMFPGMRHAFDDAGHGYGATFNRKWPLPLYHIDHVLLGADLIALRYDLVDPQMARHKAQVAVLRGLD